MGSAWISASHLCTRYSTECLKENDQWRQLPAALIKQVREDTGAGMLDVKKALTEAEGDVARAKEIIRAKGIAAAGKREGRKAQEGTIASKVVETANGETGYAVELNSETDFVAKTPKFVGADRGSSRLRRGRRRQLR